MTSGSPSETVRWVPACARAALETSGKLERLVEGRAVLLIWRGGEVAPWACAAHCPHAFAPLIDGAVKGGRLHCARHLASFDLATGAPDETWRIPPLWIFPARVREEAVEIALTDAVS